MANDIRKINVSCLARGERDFLHRPTPVIEKNEYYIKECKKVRNIPFDRL